MKSRISVVVLIPFLLGEYSIADDLELALEFSPILILTEDTHGDFGNIRVVKPEPIEIVGADSVAGIWYNAKTLGGQRIGSAPYRRFRPFSEAHDLESNTESICPVDFSENHFAALAPRCESYFSGSLPIGLDVTNPVPPLEEVVIPVSGGYVFPGHFNYPGTTPALWDSVYFGIGEYAGNDYMGDNFRSTSYVHIYKTTHEEYADSVTVIQYFYFYPYNHWWNNHEGDWQRVHVVVNSRDHETAEVLGVEYLLHKAHLSYYENFGTKPDITSGFVFRPREEIRLIQETHPVVYVGAGSHAAYPIGGRFRVYRRGIDNSPGLDFEIWESMTHTGLVLSTLADNSHRDLWESYGVELLEEPDTGQVGNNYGLPSTRSWLGADVQWGTPVVPAGNSIRAGNDSPQGPWRKGWEQLKNLSQNHYT